MNFEDWKPIRRNMREYLRHLEAYVTEFIPFWLRDPSRISSILTPKLIELADDIAHGMVTGVAANNARSWRAAASRSMRGRFIFEAMQREMQGHVGAAANQMVRENARLIRSLPETLAQRANLFIATETMQGKRSEDVAKSLRTMLPRLTESRIQLIARTETHKTQTAINRARAENLNLDWFEWESSHDERVRLSHRKISGVLARWSDPPSPEALANEKSIGTYLPGNIWNCRCLALPLVTVGEVSWPHRVYMAGRVESMSRAQFERFNHMPKAA